MPDQSAGNRPTPELGAAVSQLVTAVQKGGTNIAMYIMMALVAASPIAVQQTQVNRGPGSVEYLNEADFVVMGPEAVEVGSLVRLSVADYDPTSVRWNMDGDCQEYGKNNAELMFAMPNGPKSVSCSMIRQGQLYLTSKTVGTSTPAPVEPVVTPEPVEPVVEPTPEPEPVEPEPEPLTAIGKKILELANSSDLDQGDAEQVAKNLRKAADESEGKNPRSLVLRTVELNEDLDLSDEATEGIQVLLQTLAEDGDMVTMKQHLEVWLEMAAGFEAYAE